MTPDPRNVRDALLEAGYSPEEVDDMLRAAEFRSLLQKAADYCQGLDCEWCGSTFELSGEHLDCTECHWWTGSVRLLISNTETRR